MSTLRFVFGSFKAAFVFAAAFIAYALGLVPSTDNGPYRLGTVKTVRTTRTNNPVVAYAVTAVGLMVAVLFVSNAAFPTASAAGVYSASNAHGIVRGSEGLPYIKYARPLRPTCPDGSGIAFETLGVSKGGNTYSEMYHLYADNGLCPAAPVVEKKDKDSDTPSTSTPNTPPTVTPEPPTTTPEPPVVTPAPKKDKCNNGFGNGPDTACKTHGNGANQDNNGQQANGHVPGGAKLLDNSTDTGATHTNNGKGHK